MSAESLPPLPSDTPPSVPTAAIGNNPTNANKSTNKNKDKDPYANRDPFPLVKNYDSLPIIPHDALPLEQNKYNKNWVLCTQHILPALTGKSYEDYNPFDEKDTQNRINDGLEVLKKLNEIGLEHLQKAIGELFNKKGKKEAIEVAFAIVILQEGKLGPFREYSTEFISGADAGMSLKFKWFFVWNICIT